MPDEIRIHHMSCLWFYIGLGVSFDIPSVVGSTDRCGLACISRQVCLFAMCLHCLGSCTPCLLVKITHVVLEVLSETKCSKLVPSLEIFALCARLLERAAFVPKLFAKGDRRCCYGASGSTSEALQDFEPDLYHRRGVVQKE